MSASPANVPYRSAAQTDAKLQGQPRPLYQLPDSCPIKFDGYAFDQDYAQLLSQWQNAITPFNSVAPYPLNTPASSIGLADIHAILTGLTQPSDMGAGLGKYSGRFHRVPATWNDYSKSLSFTFPGFLNTVSGQPRRDPVTDTVQVRLQMDYFVLDPGNVISGCSAGSPATATTVKDSAGVAVNCVYQLSDITLTAKSVFGCYVSGTPDFTQRTNSLVPSGGIVSAGTTYLQTDPTPAHYKNWISAATTFKWASLAWDGSTDGAGSGNGFGQLVAEASRLEPYAGNIVARLTQYVLAI